MCLVVVDCEVVIVASSLEAVMQTTIKASGLDSKEDPMNKFSLIVVETQVASNLSVNNSVVGNLVQWMLKLLEGCFESYELGRTEKDRIVGWGE